MKFRLKILDILIPLYLFELNFVAAKNMSMGSKSADYLLAKKTNDSTDYYSKESVGTVYDPSGLLSEFGIKHGDIIDENDFRALCGGYNPRTGEALLKNSGDKHRAGTDFAFSPSKSFTALWATTLNPEIREKLEQINRESVQTGLDHLNTKATTRLGAGGNLREAISIAAVQFQHGANRDMDPHLHLHNPFLNLCLTSDGKWRTIEPRSLMQWQTSTDALYQADLIYKTKQLLPSLKINKSANGHSFEIEGVPISLIEAWSNRRKEILAAAEKEGITIDDVGGMEKMFYKTRSKKEMLPEDPHLNWSKFAEIEHNFEPDKITELLNAPAIISQPLTQSDINIRVGNVITELTKTESAVKENALLRAVAEEFFGDMNSKQIIEVFEKLKSGEILLHNADRVVRLGGFDGMDYYSTLSMQTTELRLSELAEKMANDGKHAIDPIFVEAAIAEQSILSGEQGDSVRHTGRPCSVSVIEGAAGSGKTTAITAVVKSHVLAGYTVYGLAPSWAAAKVLSNDAKIDARAVAGFIVGVEKGVIKLTNKHVLMIDEAGLLGSKDAEKLLSFAEKYGCKIVMMGEEKQLSPVAAGPALSIIMEKTGVASIETIRRQKTAVQREMVAAFRVGETDVALHKLENEDGLRFHETKKSTMNAMVQDWANYTHQHPDKSTLLLAVKNADVRQINTQVRSILRKRGVITGTDVSINTPAPNASTKATLFAIGEQIIFKQSDKGVS